MAKTDNAPMPYISFSQDTMSCNLSQEGGVSHSLIELLMAKASYAPMPYIFWVGLGEDRENRPLLLLLSLLLSFFSSLPSLKNISSFFSFFSLFPKKHPSLPSSLSSPSSPIWWSYSLMASLLIIISYHPFINQTSNEGLSVAIIRHLISYYLLLSIH